MLSTLALLRFCQRLGISVQLDSHGAITGLCDSRFHDLMKALMARDDLKTELLIDARIRETGEMLVVGQDAEDERAAGRTEYTF